MSGEFLLREPSRVILHDDSKQRESSRGPAYSSGLSSLTRDSARVIARDTARGRYHLVTDVLFNELMGTSVSCKTSSTETIRSGDTISPSDERRSSKRRKVLSSRAREYEITYPCKEITLLGNDDRPTPTSSSCSDISPRYLNNELDGTVSGCHGDRSCCHGDCSASNCKRRSITCYSPDGHREGELRKRLSLRPPSSPRQLPPSPHQRVHRTPNNSLPPSPLLQRLHRSAQTTGSPLLCMRCSSFLNPTFNPFTLPTTPPSPRADVVLVNSTTHITHADSLFRAEFEDGLIEEYGLTVQKMKSREKAYIYTVVGGGWQCLVGAAEDFHISCPLDVVPDRHRIEDEVEDGIVDKIMGFFETDQEVDYISAPFRWDKKELFAGIEDPDTFFRSSLRSFLTHHILIRTDVSKKKDTSDGINIRGLNYLKLKGVYTDVFILHDRPSTLHRRKAFKEVDEDTKVVDPRKELWDSWKLWYKFQPLWKIRNYFGEKIAFYFAWIELYIMTLILPTIFGIVVFVYGIMYAGRDINLEKGLETSVTTALYSAFTVFNNPATPWFSLALCIWGTLFVEQWKRRSNSLKYEWDVSNFEQLEPDRPQFYGSKTRKNPITEEEEWYYPFYRLYLKISFSVLTIAFMVLLVIASTLGVIVFRAAFNAGQWLVPAPSDETLAALANDSLRDALVTENKDKNDLYTSVMSSILNALAIMLLGFVYERLAYILTNWENHRTQTAYDDALIIKLFAFQFVNNYASLIYIAFFKEGASGADGMFGNSNWKDTCGYEDSNGNPLCYPMLVMQVAVLLILKPMPKFCKDVCLPIVLGFISKFKNRFISRGNNDNVEAVNAGPEKTTELIDIIEEDRKLIAGDTDFTLSEYTEKCIMYGIIMLFGTVFPLAPLVALICNMVDVRVDGYRILWKNRRYIAQRAEDIGIWQYILELLNMVGVVVNSLILAFTLKGSKSIIFNPDDNGNNSYEPWMVAFAFEHVCFALKFIVSYIIPDVPSDVQFKMRKEQFQVNQLFEKGQPKKDSKPSPNGDSNPAV